MPRALLGSAELWSVCGAERLEEWVLDAYVEGGPRVAPGSTGSTLPQQVPASSGRIRTIRRCSRAGSPDDVAELHPTTRAFVRG